MAWVSPRTWTAALVTAPQLNEQIRDNTNHLKTSIDADGIPVDIGIVSKSADYTVSMGTDNLVKCTGTFTITLPTAVGRSGRSVKVKNVSTGIITMATTSSQTIDATSAALTQLFQGDCLTFESDNANWQIV